jgi:hypothetical protein
MPRGRPGAHLRTDKVTILDDFRGFRPEFETRMRRPSIRVSRCSKLARVWIQGSIHVIGIACNERQISLRGLIRFRPPLFPIPKGAKRNVITDSKFFLGQLQSPPDDFRLGRSLHSLKIGRGQRLRIGITARGALDRLS